MEFWCWRKISEYDKLEEDSLHEALKASLDFEQDLHSVANPFSRGFCNLQGYLIYLIFEILMQMNQGSWQFLSLIDTDYMNFTFTATNYLLIASIFFSRFITQKTFT